MDKTLREYLNHADTTYNFLDKYFIAMSNEQIEEKITELQANIKTIQAVCYQIATVSNVAVRALKNRNKITKKPINVKIDPYPNSYDVGLLRSLNPVEHKEVADDINIPVKTVETIAEIPCSSLYYVNELKQFAINVEGIVIKGNLGNIVNYQQENSVKCEYGPDCNSFVKNIKCSYYHDPEDYIKHNLPVSDCTKNFTSGSWIYSKKKTTKSYFARHIGSKDRIIHDLKTIKRTQFRDEIANRESQLMHDLLIYFILNSSTLLERYIPWKKMPINIKG